jgi:hypothetical protein
MSHRKEVSDVFDVKIRVADRFTETTGNLGIIQSRKSLTKLFSSMNRYHRPVHQKIEAISHMPGDRFFHAKPLEFGQSACEKVRIVKGNGILSSLLSKNCRVS